MTDSAWQQWEREVNDLLGLRCTPASGARWHNIGDGADNDRDSVFALIVDCKFTEKGSFSLKEKDLRQWCQRAAELGKRFAMPVRFRRGGVCADYIVLEFNDFAELLQMVKDRGVH